MIGGRRPLHGRKIGDRRVRVERPHSPYFRYTGPGQLTAKEAASVPTTPAGRFGRASRRSRSAGRSTPTRRSASACRRRRRSRSSARTRSAPRRMPPRRSCWRSSWPGPARQPSGSRSRSRSRSRRSWPSWPSATARSASPTPPAAARTRCRRRTSARLASLVAASALLIDYNLTAAVSTSSAVEQIVSAVPSLDGSRVVIGVAAIGLITLANLRGVREAGNIFAIPTYLFLFSALLMIGIGVYRIVVLGEGGLPPPPEIVESTRVTAEGVGILILLRAFASGAVALTGTEAIATGVPAFQPPESQERRHDAHGHGRDPRDPLHRHHVPRHELRGLPDGGPQADRDRPGRTDGLRHEHRVLLVPGLHGAAPVPRREHVVRRLPASRRGPRPRMASSHASSASGATGWPSRWGSSCSAWSPRRSWSWPAVTPTP